MENREQEITLDIRDIMGILQKRVILIVTIVVTATLISGILSFFILKPVYQSKISVVIGGKAQLSADKQYDFNDIMMYQNLVKTYAQIAQSRTVAQKTIDKLKLTNITPEQLQKVVTVTPQVNTQIMDIKVNDKLAIESRDVVNVLAANFIDEAKRIYPNGNIQIIDNAVVPKLPISPNKKLNIAIAFFLALMLSIGISFLLEYMDSTIKTEADVDRYLGIPIIGLIPKFTEQLK